METCIGNAWIVPLASKTLIIAATALMVGIPVLGILSYRLRERIGLSSSFNRRTKATGIAHALR